MNHRFFSQCYDEYKLLDGCNKLSTFVNRLSKQSEQHPELWDPLVYVGDGFEAFVETLIKYSPIDKRINIREYRPWDPNKDGPDMGIDGLGISFDGKIHAVQAKFRSNSQTDLTANQDHISNFVAMAGMKYGKDDVDLTIFTTAKGLLSSINADMYSDKVRTLGFSELSHIVDENVPFWVAFLDEIRMKKAANLIVAQTQQSNCIVAQTVV